jgi:aspartate kinase
MKILKFGGTSLENPARIGKVADLIQDDQPQMVVLSAIGGTTDKLEEITHYLYNNNRDAAREITAGLEKKYRKLAEELFRTDEGLHRALGMISSHFNHIRSFFNKSYSTLQQKSILAQGELVSSALFQFFLEERNVGSQLVSALHFMRIDKNEEPDELYIQENLERELAGYPETNLFITQGYICRNAFGEIDNLKRGGSDYTASLVGSALDAEEVQIWTDVDGFHNNDPRYVENTSVIRHLSFDEAAELAYFGAKILHPASVLPCKLKEIPVRLKNTFNPDDEGTLITTTPPLQEIRAVAAKDNIAVIRIQSNRMLLAYGFIRKVFEVFEVYQTPVDVITTSEVAVSVTIDKLDKIESILHDLKKYGTVEVEYNQSIICVVGNLMADEKGIIYKIFDALHEVPVRMISYGGNQYNVTLLVHSENKTEALNALSRNLFSYEK